MSTQPRAEIPFDVAPGVLGCYAFRRCGARSRTASPSSFSAFPTGAHMKLSISFKHVESHKPVESEIERRVGKLGKLLRSYSPDLVQLHGGFSKTPRTGEDSCSLNLSLPTGTLHATGGPVARKPSASSKPKSRNTRPSCAKITNGDANAVSLAPKFSPESAPAFRLWRPRAINKFCCFVSQAGAACAAIHETAD